MDFDTIRSDLGERIFLLKNRNKIQVVDEIIELIKPFLDSWDKLSNVDTIIPVPPTKKNRPYQPAFEIAYAIAEYTGKSYIEDVLVKTTTTQSKDMGLEDKKDLEGSITVTKKAKREHNVLLVDDLTRSGMTFKQCVEALREDNNVGQIYVLAMTKTRR